MKGKKSQGLQVDHRKTLDYYKSWVSEPRDCRDCQHYYDKIEEVYPELCRYLRSFSIDPLRPWELYLIKKDEVSIQFTLSQYVVFGSCPDHFLDELGDVTIGKATTFPTTKIHAPHFVLECGPIELPL